MKQAPEFERMIVDAGIHLTKLWFLSQFDHEGKVHAIVAAPGPLIVMRARDAAGD